MVKTKAEEALNLSLDDIIKRNRETVKPKAKSEGKDDKGGRKSRGAVRGRGKNGGDARVAVVKVVQTKRSGAGAGRRSVSGNFVDYDGSVHEVSTFASVYSISVASETRAVSYRTSVLHGLLHIQSTTAAF